MLNYVFENANEKLTSIIKNKLDVINATNDERDRAEKELTLIEEKDEARAFILFYELVQYMKKEDIYFSAREIKYTCLYTSFLLGLLDYNPMKLNISTLGYEESSIPFSIDIQRSKKIQILKYLKTIFGRNSLYKTTWYSKLNNDFCISAIRYLISNNHAKDLEKIKIGRQVAVKLENENQNYKSDNFIVFNLLNLNTLDKIQEVDANVDYGNYEEKDVYEFMSKVQIVPEWLSREKIEVIKPTNLKELAYCVPDVVNVNERNISHWVNYAIVYYKLAKIRMIEQKARE